MAVEHELLAGVDEIVAFDTQDREVLVEEIADIDVFDIEISETDITRFVDTVKAISPTFGGINLEDIKAPECFEIERRLKAELKIARVSSATRCCSSKASHDGMIWTLAVRISGEPSLLERRAANTRGPWAAFVNAAR